MTACPTDDELAAFCAGAMSAAESGGIQTHIDECELCHALVGELVRGRAPAGADADADASLVLTHPRPGLSLDGFVLRARLGAGAMGDVWLADEPALERQVALKLLRPDLSAPDASELLQREARALAQLSHPNVVAVHRVGHADHRHYIAMEFVSGATLAEWLGDARPSVAERVDAMIQAGRGLAAAHGAGVIHRDFKPANVFMGEDTRVRVGDFGLARAPVATIGSDGAPLRTAMAGTPVYMAPEQLRGASATEASDQFAFAVSLYEVAYGVRPFAGVTEKDLEQAIARGQPRLPGHRARVPRWLRAVALRGLSEDPAKRFPSMDAMVAALEAGRQRGRRLAFGAAVVGAAIVSAAIAIPLAGDDAPSCAAAANDISAVWNTDRSTSIRRHILDTAGDGGGVQWDLAAAGFDAYATAWSSMRVETCEATYERRTQSAQLFDRRMFCLDRRRSQLDAVLSSLADAETPRVIARAAEMAANLPPIDACADAEWLSESPMPPVEKRAAIDEAFAALDDARALGFAGRYKDDLAACTALEPTAEKLDYLPLSAELAFEIARSTDQLGDDRAREALERASLLAARLEQPSRVFDMQRRLVRMIAYQNDYDEALTRAAVVENLANLTGRPDDVAWYHETIGAIHAFRGDMKLALAARREALAALPPAAMGTSVEAAIRQGLGLALMRLGELEAAAPELERALALYREIYGPNHPMASGALVNLGNLAWFRGNMEEAKAAYEQAMAVQEFVDGGCKAQCAITVGNVALAQHAVDELEESLSTYDRAIALRTEYFGPDHPEVALALANKGEVLGDLRRFDEAEAAIAQSLAIRKKVDAPRHYDLVGAYLSLGSLRLARGTPESIAAAIEPYDLAISIGTESVGPDHAQVGWGKVQRASALLALGRVAEAHRGAEAGVTVLTKALGPDDDNTIEATTVLARVLLRQGKHARVETLLAPAVPADGTVPADRAETAFVLAQVWLQTGKRAEAIAMANRAARALRDDPAVKYEPLAERIDAWLAAHAP